jgi:AcrR family transcriptional regulator
MIQRGERGAREKVLASAYELFSRHGVRAIGVNAIVKRSGVAKMTLYRHFPSKDDLVLAFLEQRERRWTREWLQADVERRATLPRERLLAIFDVFDEWFHRPDFEGCSFINVLLENPGLSARQATLMHLANIRTFVSDLAAAAGIPDPPSFARSWHILMKGSIVSAGEGDVDAARRARELGQLLLERWLAPAPADAPADRPANSTRRHPPPRTPPVTG